MKQNAWDVWLNGKYLDTVWFSTDCDCQYVKQSLIDHDGYSPNIIVLYSK